MIEQQDLRTLMSGMQLPVNHIEVASKPFIYVEYVDGNLIVSDSALRDLTDDEMRFALAYAYRYGQIMPNAKSGQAMGRDLGQHTIAFVFGLALVSMTMAGSVSSRSPVVILLLLFWVVLTMRSFWKMIWARIETRFLGACSFAVGRTMNVRAGISYFRKSQLDPLKKRNSLFNSFAFKLRSSLIAKFEASFTGIG